MTMATGGAGQAAVEDRSTTFARECKSGSIRATVTSDDWIDASRLSGQPVEANEGPGGELTVMGRVSRPSGASVYGATVQLTRNGRTVQQLQTVRGRFSAKVVGDGAVTVSACLAHLGCSACFDAPERGGLNLKLAESRVVAKVSGGDSGGDSTVQHYMVRQLRRGHVQLRTAIECTKGYIDLPVANQGIDEVVVERLEDSATARAAVDFKSGINDLGLLELRPARQVRGKVVATATGAPVPRARIDFDVTGAVPCEPSAPTHGFGRVETSDSGRFCAFGLPDLAPVAMRVSAEGFARTVVAVPASEVEVNVRLDQGTVVRGSTITRNGVPVPKRLRLWDIDELLAVGGVSPQVAPVDEDGAFEFRNLAPGRYRITGGDDDAARVEQQSIFVTGHAPVLVADVAVEPVATARVAVALIGRAHSFGYIWLELADTGGVVAKRPLIGNKIMGTDYKPVMDCCVFDNVPANDYTIRVMGESSYAELEVPLLVAGDEDLEIELRFD